MERKARTTKGSPRPPTPGASVALSTSTYDTCGGLVLYFLFLVLSLSFSFSLSLFLLLLPFFQFRHFNSIFCLHLLHYPFLLALHCHSLHCLFHHRVLHFLLRLPFHLINCRAPPTRLAQLKLPGDDAPNPRGRDRTH